jgi:hypothetical protein
MVAGPVSATALTLGVLAADLGACERAAVALCGKRRFPGL